VQVQEPNQESPQPEEPSQEGLQPDEQVKEPVWLFNFCKIPEFYFL